MTADARLIPTREFSWLVFLALALALGLSVATFSLLVRRWTRSRIWVEITTWARRRGYKARLDLVNPPPPLDTLLPLANVRVGAAVSNETGGFFRLESGPVERALSGSSVAVESPRWHVLVRQLETTWPATALRPAGAMSSFVDLFSLASFPLMGDTQRFVVYGSDSAPARKISASSARSLLPPDVGLLLADRYLLLDFSDRPFDPIEFERMEALAASVAQHLPMP
jgi:hypothetical protein